MKQDWDVTDIIAQLRRCHRAASNSWDTGFVQWPCKQDLYQVKFVLDEMLKNTPTFSGEQEWLDQQSKQQVWNTLKK
jgi:hypothetical protein